MDDNKIVARYFFEFLLLHIQFNQVILNVLLPYMLFIECTLLFSLNLVKLN
jgi:hypothetical protein